MDTSSRYYVAQSRMAERHAEAAHSRLAKRDPFDDRFDDRFGDRSETRGEVQRQAGSHVRLLGRIAGLRFRGIGRPHAAATATR